MADSFKNMLNDPEEELIEYLESHGYPPVRDSLTRRIKLKLEEVIRRFIRRFRTRDEPSLVTLH